MTIRVLAIMVERFLQVTGSSEVQIADAALEDLPDLTAWRIGDCVSLTTTR